MSGTEKVALKMTRPCGAETPDGPCVVEGGLLREGCTYHHAMRTARNLSPDDYARLLADLAAAGPVPESERQRRRLTWALENVTSYGRLLRDCEKRAVEAGATRGQVLDARMAAEVAK